MANHEDSLEGKRKWENLWQNRKRVHVYRNVVDAAERCFANLHDIRILEVGCGRGATLLELARRGALVTGLDYAQSAVASCRELQREAGLQERVEFVFGDARQIPFESESFDLVYSVGLIEHFDKPENILAEQRRVLKPDGYLLVQVPQKYSIYTLAKMPLTKIGKWPYGEWETQFSNDALTRLVQGSGFHKDYTFGYGSFTLALLRHFFFPTLDFDWGGKLWNRVALVRTVRAHTALDVGVVARKNGD